MQSSERTAKGWQSLGQNCCMGVMSLVTLLLSLQLGAAQTSAALRNSKHRCRMQSCANSLLPSLALGSRSLCLSSPASLPKHTCISRGLRHSHQHNSKPCLSRPGTGGDNIRKPALRRRLHDHQASISNSFSRCKQPFARQRQLLRILGLKAG